MGRASGIAVAGTPVDTGHAKESWGQIEELKSAGFGLSGAPEQGRVFGNTADYAEVLDSGLYPGEGPKTIQTAKGIFSRQAPEGIIDWMEHDTQFHSFLAQLFVQTLQEVLDKELK